jgi:hypothetical protein
LRVSFGPVASYEDGAAGLMVSPGPASGDLYGNSAATSGMGTDALGPVLSIQSGMPDNESMVFEIFQTDGATLGAAEGATDVVLAVTGLPTTIQFQLTAEDKNGAPLGMATATTGDTPVDVSSLIPGEIHRLTVEAITGPLTPQVLSYTHVCLGYDPVP